MGQKQSALTPEEISDMRLMTKLTASDIVAFHKQFIKQFPKGRVTKEDMKRLYKTTYPDGNPDDAVNALFRVYDMDSNGTMDFREFLAGLCVMTSGNQDEKLRLAFELYDADGNGSISKTEIRSLIQAMYKATSSGNYDPNTANSVGATLFEQLDQNKNNRISLQEFIDGARSDQSIIRIISSAQPQY